MAFQLAANTGKPRDETKSHLFQRLGILLARGNAALFLTRRPNHAEAPIDGDVDH